MSIYTLSIIFMTYSLIGVIFMIKEKIVLQDIWIKVSAAIILIMAIGIGLVLANYLFNIQWAKKIFNDNWYFVFSLLVPFALVMLSVFTFFILVNFRIDCREAAKKGRPYKGLLKTFSDWINKPDNSEDAEALKQVYLNPLYRSGPFDGF